MGLNKQYRKKAELKNLAFYMERHPSLTKSILNNSPLVMWNQK